MNSSRIETLAVLIYTTSIKNSTIEKKNSVKCFSYLNLNIDVKNTALFYELTLDSSSEFGSLVNIVLRILNSGKKIIIIIMANFVYNFNSETPVRIDS